MLNLDTGSDASSDQFNTQWSAKARSNRKTGPIVIINSAASYGTLTARLRRYSSRGELDLGDIRAAPS